jgi:hypothetical protein
MSDPDLNHIHHILRRKFKSVKLTVLSLYGISFVFCLLGVALAYAHITSTIRAWVIYLAAVIIFGGISLIALHAARRHEKA